MVLEHTRPTSSLNLYRVISDHAVERTMHVLTGTLYPEHLPGEFVGVTTAPHAGVTEISFRLYDHGLMLLEMLADVDPRPTEDPAGLAGRLDQLQAAAVAMGERVARETVTRYLDPVLRLLRRADRDGRILVAATPEEDPLTAEFGEPLWVTRSLVLDPAQPGPTRSPGTGSRTWCWPVTSAARRTGCWPAIWSTWSAG